VFWRLGVVVGTGIGLIAGIGCKHLSLRPVLQSNVAALTAFVASTATMLIVWMLRPGGL
jgi:hypothetical protein